MYLEFSLEANPIVDSSDFRDLSGRLLAGHSESVFEVLYVGHLSGFRVFECGVHVG